jgi:hypothetical protein
LGGRRKRWGERQSAAASRSTTTHRTIDDVLVDATIEAALTACGAADRTG